MDYWQEFLRNPSFEVLTIEGGDSTDNHCVLWCGYEDHDHEELWDFGAGNRWKGRMPPLPSFPQYGGETLCGLEIESGQSMYGPRWRLSTELFGRSPGYEREEYTTSEAGRLVLIDMHGITCMTCRHKLMYGICQLIDMLTSLRDEVGIEYVEDRPLIHGKNIIEREQGSRGTISEVYRYRCKTAADHIHPQLVDDVLETDAITCPECLVNIEAGVLP